MIHLAEQEDKTAWEEGGVPDFDSQRIGVMAAFNSFDVFVTEFHNTLDLLEWTLSEVSGKIRLKKTKLLEKIHSIIH